MIAIANRDGFIHFRNPTDRPIVIRGPITGLIEAGDAVIAQPGIPLLFYPYRADVQATLDALLVAHIRGAETTGVTSTTKEESMPNNIVDSRYLSGSLAIDPAARADLIATHAKDLPAACFLTDLTCVAPDGRITAPVWRGSWSGISYVQGALAAALSRTTGAADVLFVWDDGREIVVSVANGLVTRAAPFRRTAPA